MNKTWTYVRAIPTDETIQDIAKFCKRNNIVASDFYDDPHCTIIYSKKIIPVETIILPPYNVPIIGKSAQLYTFDTKDDGLTLVIKFASNLLSDINNKIKSEYDLESIYNYTPHITLQKNMNAVVENKKLHLKLQFDRIIMDNEKGLNTSR